jgi:hypothetical protein
MRRAFTSLKGARSFRSISAHASWNLLLDVLNCRIGEGAVRQFDIAAMFISLWLLVSMIIDAVTPTGLSFYMIAAVAAPAVAVLALLYWRGVPKQDFAIVFATLWLIATIVLEFISPTPLPSFTVFIAGVPLLIVGCATYYLRWRHSKRRPDRARFDV